LESGLNVSTNDVLVSLILPAKVDGKPLIKTTSKRQSGGYI